MGVILLNDNINITGTHIHYYAICHRKLWYFSRGICLEAFNEDVKIGKAIHEYAYPRKKKEIQVDANLRIDFIDKDQTIHEVKKSSKNENAHLLQLRFYMERANERGLEVKKGVLHYPEEGKTVTVHYDEDFFVIWERIKKHIADIVGKEGPPQKTKATAFCKKCSYFELCYC